MCTIEIVHCPSCGGAGRLRDGPPPHHDAFDLGWCPTCEGECWVISDVEPCEETAAAAPLLVVP